MQNVLQVISSGREEWQIIYVSGQIMKTGILSPGRNEINISTLASGNYWLRVNTKNQIQAVGFRKQ